MQAEHTEGLIINLTERSSGRSISLGSRDVFRKMHPHGVSENLYSLTFQMNMMSAETLMNICVYLHI